MRELYADDVLWLRDDRNLVVCGWTNTCEVKHLRMVHDASCDLSKKYSPSNVATLSVIIRGTQSFDEQVRQQVRAQYQDDHGSRMAVAHLILMAGLAGTAARAFFHTVILLSRAPTPSKVFADPNESSSWLKGHLDRGPELRS